MKHSFFSKYEVYWKRNKIEAVYTKTKINNHIKWSFSLKNMPWHSTHSFQRLFHWLKHLWNSSFDSTWICAIIFLWMSFISSNLSLELNFLLINKKCYTELHVNHKGWPRLIAFHMTLIPLGKVWIQLFSLQLWVNSRTDCSSALVTQLV